MFWDVQEYLAHCDGASEDTALTMSQFVLVAARHGSESLEDAQRVMVHINAIVYDGRFKTDSVAAAGMQRLAEGILRRHHTDDLILDKVASVLVALRPEPGRVLPILLVTRQASLRVQRNVLDLLLQTLTVPEGEDEDTLEEVRQYAMFAIDCHPASRHVCHSACTLLLRLRGLDEQQVATVMKAMATCPQMYMVQLAGCTFVGKAQPSWLTAAHDLAVMQAMTVHGHQRDILAAGLKALAAGAAMACKTKAQEGKTGEEVEEEGMCTCQGVLDTVRAVACLHRADRRLQVDAMDVMDKVLSRACRRADDPGPYLDVCRLAMENHATDASVQVAGAKVMYTILNAARPPEPPCLHVRLVHIQTLARAVLVFCEDSRLLQPALPALATYHARQDADTDHCLMAAACLAAGTAWQDSEITLASVMLVLAGTLRLCTKRDADFYTAAVTTTMAAAGNRERGFESTDAFLCADLYCRVAWEWGNLREEAAHAFLPVVCAAMKAQAGSKSLQAHGIRYIKCVIMTLPLTVAVCDEVITRLAKAMLCLSETYMLLFAIQSLSVMLVRCPKAGKRFLRSEAFQIVHQVRKPSRRPAAAVLAACQVLFQHIVKRHPNMKALLS